MVRVKYQGQANQRQRGRVGAGRDFTIVGKQNIVSRADMGAIIRLILGKKARRLTSFTYLHLIWEIQCD